MGYHVVTVNPLKPFPLLSFGLANVVSLDDAKKQIEKRFETAGLAEIKANAALQELAAKAEGARDWLTHLEKKSMTDTIKEEIKKTKEEIAELEATSRKITAPIRVKHEANANAEISKLEARWAEGKIQPALDLHLARQERRRAHFKASCRFAGCDNPRRQKRGSGGERSTKAQRPGVRPLFCGAHIGLRKCLAREALAELHASSGKRVAIA